MLLALRNIDLKQFRDQELDERGGNVIPSTDVLAWLMLHLVTTFDVEAAIVIVWNRKTGDISGLFDILK